MTQCLALLLVTSIFSSARLAVTLVTLSCVDGADNVDDDDYGTVDGECFHHLCSPGMTSAKVPEWKLKIILF